MKELNDLNKYVNEYYRCNLTDGNQLSRLLQKITGLLYYLESVRSDVHNAFETNVFNMVKEKSTVARATNAAHVEFPQMYQLRRIMDAGYRVADAIRTNISYLKSERVNSNQTNAH